MPGSNKSGKPNTSDYLLGRGILYLAPLIAGLPQGYRDVGNATDFNLTLESETLPHQTSRTGLRVTDKEVILSQSASISFTLDEINNENLAEFLSGESTTYTNPVTSIQAEHTAYTSVILGRWYDIVDANNNRVYNITADNSLIVKNDTDDTALVVATDYELDAVAGRVFLLVSASNIVDGEDLSMSWSADSDNTAGSVDEVRGLTTTTKASALKFIGENPAANSGKFEVQIHQISLKAEGDLGLISDDWAEMQFTGVAEANAIASPNSPLLNVRDLVFAAA